MCVYIYICSCICTLISINFNCSLSKSSCLSQENLVVWLHLKFGDSFAFQIISITITVVCTASFNENFHDGNKKKRNGGRAGSLNTYEQELNESSLENKIRHVKIWSGIEEKYKIKWEIIIVAYAINRLFNGMKSKTQIV